MVLDENWFWFDLKHLKTQRKHILDTLRQESKRGVLVRTNLKVKQRICKVKQILKTNLKTLMGDGLARGSFSTHDTLVHKSISNFFSMNHEPQHPRLTVNALINPQIFLMSLSWKKCIRQPKLFSNGPLHECIEEIQLEIIKFHENHKC